MMHILLLKKLLLLQTRMMMHTTRKQLLKNALFTSYITKINNTLVDNEEDLDVVMTMHNLIEYSKNYSGTLENLWNY